MIGPKGKGDSRLDVLERELLALKRQLGGQPSRYGHGAAPSQVRLARTASDTEGGGYPETGNTFPIIFLDGDFDEDPGTNTLTTVDRQSEPAAKYAHDVGNVYRAEGEKVWVARQNGKYWILGSGGGTSIDIVVFTLNSDLALSDPSKSATVVRALLGSEADGAAIIVKNTDGVHEGEEDAIGWAIKDSEGEWEIMWVQCPGRTIPPQQMPASPNAPQNPDDYSNPYLDPSSPDYIPPIEMMQPTPVEFLAV